MEMRAEFDGKYRYTLWRGWNDQLPPLVFLMLNPSIASGERDDATVRRCIYYAKRWGYGALLVRNLFALVSTDPRALYAHDNPVGPHNNRHILDACTGRDVVAAWGNHGTHLGRDQHVLALVRRYAARLWHLGPLTKAGHPHHPLRLTNDVPRNLWT
jgi:hypothetical protein